MLPERVWDRHANPKSGWTRLLAFPVLLYSIYARRRGLLAATVAFLAVNPILFSAPNRESPPDDFMYRAVRAEQWWTDEGRPVVGLGYPEVLSVLAGVASALALHGAATRRPVRTVLGGTATMALKLWFVRELARYHAAAESADAGYPE